MGKAAAIAKTNVMRLLDAKGIAYQAYSYHSSDGKIDGVSVAQKIGQPAEKVFKTLVAIGSSGDFYVFVIPVISELDLKKAARAAGEKSIEMCPAKELLKHTGYIHGGCSPVAMKRAFATYIDENAILLERMICSAGKIGWQIELEPDQLLHLVAGEYADLCK
jgi:Cys-tRNA(Pro)/Cys-tRNA(Cys) deacylase